MPAFAHTATASGPNTEILLLGAAMIVLAGVFFFQKTASRQVSLVLAVLGVVAITGAFTVAKDSGDGGHGHGVSLTIAAPEDGAVVDAGIVPIEVELDGAELAGESTSENAGHVHVYVDGGELEMLSSTDIEVELEPGEHEVEVEFVGAGHAALDPPVIDSVTVTAE
jgi:hypothetical protein